jgi:hypothetical protein
MKRILLTAFIFALSLPVIEAGNPDAKKSKQEIKADKKAETQLLLNRLEEIKKMDLSKLNADQKEELKKELPAIGKRLQEINGIICVTIGLVIIALLAVLILF